MTHLIATLGPPVVFVAVYLEVFAIPVPAELVLVTAAVLAQRGDLSLGSVLGAATTGGIAGQASAYGLGRWRGRQILATPFMARFSASALASAEVFFKRHGGKALFLGRFVPLLRSTIGWMAGVGGLSLGRFAFWSVASALAWSLSIGLSAYYFGKAAVETVQTWGTIGIVVVVAVGAIVLLAVRSWRRRMERETPQEGELSIAPDAGS
jgi:membrane protein DedA with SNARE-associated domain